jgi:hypothetical protein
MKRFAIALGGVLLALPLQAAAVIVTAAVLRRNWNQAQGPHQRISVEGQRGLRKA